MAAAFNCRATEARRRSWLFTPGNKSSRLVSALKSSADVLIVDLEDSVPPLEKDFARGEAFSFLTNSKDLSILRALRINPVDTRAGLADLSELLDGEANPDLLIIPKAEFSSTFTILDRLLTSAGKTTQLVALIESAAGLLNAVAIGQSTARLSGLMFGAADMAADLGCDGSWEALLGARSSIVMAGAASGVACIDAPYFSLQDDTALASEIAAAIALGFNAKAAIHPKHLDQINAALSPSEEAISDAQAILDLNSSGVAVFKGKMVDEAMAKKARRILAAAGLNV